MSNKRRDLDVMKLMMSDFDVTVDDDSAHQTADSAFNLEVVFNGPSETPYEDGQWRVKVQLPPGYPFKSPSIGFSNRIYHPNVDLASGSVCLDVINQTWSPLYSLLNIFDTFLPYLLRYPNGADPLNPEAGNLYMRDQDAYNARVKKFVAQYAPAPKSASTPAAGATAAAASTSGSGSGTGSGAGSGAGAACDTSLTSNDGDADTSRTESFASTTTGGSGALGLSSGGDDDDEDDDDDGSVASDLSEMSDL